MCASRPEAPKYFNVSSGILTKIIFGSAYFTFKNVDF